jgi:ABC-2 type transport system permease protein
MGTLIRKLLRDVWPGLAVVALVLGAFQCLWAKVTERLIGHLLPLVTLMASRSGLSFQDVEKDVFEGPGRMIRNLIGGEKINLESAMDLLSIGYVHPVIQFIFCIWAVGRASGAIAGEIDRGTMELLLAQPVARYRVIAAHLGMDLITIPVLCLSLWAGNWLGYWLIAPIQLQSLPAKQLPSQNYLIELGPFKVRVNGPAVQVPRPQGAGAQTAPDRYAGDRLRIDPTAFGPALWVVGGLVFAMSGYTLVLSAAGRFRWRVLGLAILITLIQFLINLLGQMWDPIAAWRPFTLFYYYQPQQVILGHDWSVPLSEWNGGQPLCRVPMLAVLFGVGVAGYALALRIFTRRDLPAPL